MINGINPLNYFATKLQCLADVAESHGDSQLLVGLLRDLGTEAHNESHTMVRPMISS